MENKICKTCTQQFTVYDEDLDFYKRIAVPSPKSCPSCRMQRRWAIRNQNNLYRRKCDFTGEEMVSVYSADKPFRVYKEDVWWSDKWDALEYEKDYDFSRPFFEQFYELLLQVPRRGMHQDGTNENAEYTTFGMSNKNCYLSFASFYCEDSSYIYWCGFSKDLHDNFFSFQSELLYECADVRNCYNCYFLQSSENCQDSYFLDDCRNCSNCISCKNLRNKKLHIYNKPVSEEQFKAHQKQLHEEGFEEELQKFNEWKLSIPNLASRIFNSENCTGEYIENAKNCHECHTLITGGKDCKYCQFAGWDGKDMFDCTMAGRESELIIEMHATTLANRCGFCSFTRGCSDTYYSDCMSACEFCFGCSGLSHKKYCILNKQYTKEEYNELLPRIIAHMKGTTATAGQTEEYGEFFPVKCSPFAYNETIAQDHYPLTKEEALAKGYKWKEEEEDITRPSNALKCSECEKPFQITSHEKAFYKKQNIVSPKKCYKCRQARRIKLRNPEKLYNRKCDNCSDEITTSYAPERKEIIYCEKCYQESIY